VYASDSLETILSHLSTRVMNIIADGICLDHLDFLLEFLAAWKKRPARLTPMAYQWCSAISEAAGGLGLGELSVGIPTIRQLQPFLPRFPYRMRFRLQLQLQDLVDRYGHSEDAEKDFSIVGPGCDPARIDHASNHTHICPQDLIPFHYARLLPVILKIGFRLADPGHDGSALHLDHTPHHWRVFKLAFSHHDDDVVADAVSVWIIGGDPAPPGSFAHYFVKHVEGSRSFSPRLRQVTIRAIESVKYNVLEVSAFETIHLLNRLNVGVDDMVDKHVWAQLLAGVICLPAGVESLSPHYWCLLDKLSLTMDFCDTPGLRGAEVMKSLEEAEDWEKLEVWMVVVWQSIPSSTPTPLMEDVERVTLKLLSRRPSALLRFETLCKRGFLFDSHKSKLRRICDQAQAEQPPSESPSSPYVSIRPAPHLPFLIVPYSSLQSIDSSPTTCSPSFCRRRYFLKLSIVYVMGWRTGSCWLWKKWPPCRDPRCEVIPMA
jgi:hypothetical protein